MKIIFLTGVGLLVAATAFLVISAQWFTAEINRQISRLLTGPVLAVRPDNNLPEVVRRFAQRGHAAENGVPRVVEFTQDLELRQGEKWSKMTAHQHIAITRPGFVWVADGTGWPLPVVRVLDSFVDGAGLLEARLLGAVRVARFEGADADLGEAMRYVAELPWAPDAILTNPSISWREVDAQVVEARLPLPDGAAIVQFTFDDVGDIVEVYAEKRPDTSEGKTVLREWRGLFSSYTDIGGRRVPAEAEVGYVVDGAYEPYFRGRVTSYQIRL
ncbi:hypothetical protein SAMN05444851_0026 [Aliiroseovarius sediminilitoris]|uniref:Uncharacterized protein n=2 Tax=Aliiroseovarius sediminilitoris TaxID=1173584 RepID=A0A1I0MIK2_9RHOB|nr:hypothetical protein SAMN05444851_0026 [Aliiroseovarius sediminilitoris]